MVTRGNGSHLFYGWIVVIGIFLIAAVLMGTNLSFGVFFKSLETEFALSRATTSSIQSLLQLLGGICAFLGGWTLDRWGPRIVMFIMGLSLGLGLLLTSQVTEAWQLYFTYSLLAAIGFGAIYVVGMSTVIRWFNKKRGLAIGISSSGLSVGPIAMAPFASFLIANLDWRWAYRVLALIAWVVVLPASLLLKKDPQGIGLEPDGITTSGSDDKPKDMALPGGLSFFQAFRTRSFWLYIFTWLLIASALFFVATHVVRHGEDIGFTSLEAASIISFLGFTAIFGRLIMGVVADRLGRKPTAVVCALLQVGALIWLVYARELWMLYLFGAAFGFANGGLISAITAQLGDIFGLRKIGTILGMLDIGWGIGAALGAAAGGYIFDATLSYQRAFLVEIAASLVVAVLISLLRNESARFPAEATAVG